jgi:WD40 repeat protein
VIIQGTGLVASIRFNSTNPPTGGVIVDSYLDVWDLATGAGKAAHLLPFATDYLTVSGDGKRALLRGPFGVWVLLDVAELSRADGTKPPTPATPAPATPTQAPAAQRFVGHTGQVNCLALSFDGKQLASAGADGKLRLWEAESGRSVWQRDIRRGNVQTLHFDRKGEWLLGSAANRQNYTWRVDTGVTGTSISYGAPQGDECAGFDISPDGEHVLSIVGNRLRFRTFNNNGRLGTGSSGTAPVTPTGCVAVEAGVFAVIDTVGSLTYWDARTGKPGGVWVNHRKSAALCVAYNVKTQLVYTGGQDKTIASRGIKAPRLLKVLVRFKGHEGPVTCLATSADGKVVASGSKDRTLRVWDATTGKELHNFDAGEEPLGVALLPDGKTLVSCGAKGIREWQLKEPTPKKDGE